MPLSPTIGLRDWGLLALLSFVWGGSYLFVAIAVRDVSPVLIVMARVIIAAAVLLPVHFVMTGRLPASRRIWLAVAGMSVLNNIIPFILIVIGQTMIPGGLASVINATTPLFGVAFIAMAGLEPLLARKVIGIAIGIAGVAVLKGGSIFDPGSQSLGILLCLGAAASYGLGSLWAKIWLTDIAPLTAATGQLVVSSVIMLAIGVSFDHPAELLDASLQSWLAILGLALLATAFAYLIFFRVLERAGAANVLVVTMMIPVSAILLGFAVLGERLQVLEIIGAAVIIGALVIIDGRALLWLRRGGQSA